MSTEHAPSAGQVERLVRHLRFNEVSVLAIRQGRKTQTRRPLKPQPTVPEEFMTIGRCGESWAFRVGETLRVVLPDETDTGVMIRVENVRAERLHAISDEDAVAEGCPGWYSPSHPDIGETDGMTPSEEFRDLWGTIYGPENQFVWERNPWVFVYEFSVVS